MKTISYQYRNLPIPGGGYVTGLLFHPQKEDVFYARTDIGGTYRFDRTKERWISLISHVTMEDLSETFPISIALDPGQPQMLYIACGENKEGKGVLAISDDYGETFCYEKIPVLIHGNLNGRGTGERLLVDQKNSERLYFASQQEGLWVSENRGKEWRKLTAMPEDYLTFVGQTERALFVGTAGVTTRKSETMRGHCLYVSYDGGQSFTMAEVPESHEIDGCRMNGLAAQRFCISSGFLYVTFASTGRRSYVIENGYSCDSGDTIDGHVARYALSEDGTIGAMVEITPGSCSPAKGSGQEKIRRGQILDYGFSGISASDRTPGLVIASTIVKDDGDSVFLSLDYGATWKQVLYDLEDGELRFRAPYMRPECNGGHSLLHWLSDLKINPYNEKEAWFNTGTGVFRTQNLMDDVCVFSDWCDGIEETVHLNVYSLPSGPTRVLDILGDLGGFAFEELDQPCENSFADEKGNRYITCINADFSDEHPEHIIVTPRGNWTGLTKGGLILSHDYGKSFERLAMPFGLSEEIDEALHGIEHPNVNSGWVAMSPDCRNIVWSIADMIWLPVSRMVVSNDGGKNFVRSQVFRKDGSRKQEGNVKVYSDRLDSQLFYGFGEQSDFYISHDGGNTFREYLLPEEFPKTDFGKIDCANKTEVRGESGRSGVFYLALNEGGLWKLIYEKNTDSVKIKRLTKEGDAVYRAGLGIGSPKADYFRDSKAVYLNGRIDGVYGFYRTCNDGETLERLNTEKQMYGEINSIDGDSREFGRFYLATGSNGLLYGEPVKEEKPM
ncbi:MAG: endoglucanase [Lachnospiraceae bacterium]|nr:endoglucanase [Lachnospiraceae bacterium]